MGDIEEIEYSLELPIGINFIIGIISMKLWNQSEKNSVV